jgi:hypothetical protein
MALVKIAHQTLLQRQSFFAQVAEAVMMSVGLSNMQGIAVAAQKEIVQHVKPVDLASTRQDAGAAMQGAVLIASHVMQGNTLQDVPLRMLVLA